MSAQPDTQLNLSSSLPNQHEIESANHLRKILAAQMTENETVQFSVTGPNGTAEVVLGPLLNRLILDLLRAVGSGNTVISMPLGKKMTTQEAADVLNVSRPHLIKLLERGEIPYEMVGRHRRISAGEVFKYQRARDEKRNEALAELFSTDSDYL